MAAAKKGRKSKVTQIGSPIGRESSQRDTLSGLGLNKMNRSAANSRIRRRCAA